MYCANEKKLVLDKKNASADSHLKPPGRRSPAILDSSEHVGPRRLCSRDNPTIIDPPAAIHTAVEIFALHPIAALALSVHIGSVPRI
jgi:hypothetical protein